jgi:hypothetical protein
VCGGYTGFDVGGLMETLVLDDMWDVDVAVARLAYGETLRIQVGDDDGPHGPEPKIELLRVLLDTVQRTYRIGQLDYVPHPLVSRRYLQSCVIAPPRSGDRSRPRRVSPAGRPPTTALPDHED